MLFAVIVTDKPDCGDIRAAPLPAHIAWLEAHKDIIPVGGSAPRRPLARRGRLQSPDRGPAPVGPVLHSESAPALRDPELVQGQRRSQSLDLKAIFKRCSTADIDLPFAKSRHGLQPKTPSHPRSSTLPPRSGPDPASQRSDHASPSSCLGTAHAPAQSRKHSMTLADFAPLSAVLASLLGLWAWAWGAAW